MGVLIAITNSLTVSLSDVFIKKLKGENTFFIIWVRLSAALPVLAIAVTLLSKWSVPPITFFLLVFLIITPIEIIQFYLGYRAIQRSPLSLMAPLHASTSIFLIPVGYLMLGEKPDISGLIGVASIVVGSLVLGWRIGETRTPFESIKNIFREPGTFLILLGSFLVSFSITTTKYLFHYASPLLAAFYITAAIVIGLTPLAFRKKVNFPTRDRTPLLGGLALLSGASFSLHYVGLSMLPAAYYISVKRISMLFNVLAGKAFFKEDHIRERFSGALLMVVGIILIAFAQ